MCHKTVNISQLFFTQRKFTKFSQFASLRNCDFWNIIGLALDHDIRRRILGPDFETSKPDIRFWSRTLVVLEKS